MINDNVIDLLINLLENNETLSDYSLEYAIALFMNLTLKNSVKKKCVNDCKRVLYFISDLLGNSNTEVGTSHNQTLKDPYYHMNFYLFFLRFKPMSTERSTTYSLCHLLELKLNRW